MAKRTSKKEYIKSITSRYASLEGKYKEVAKLRKNHKKRINPAYAGKITAISNLVGVYKRGSRAGQLKLTDSALRNLTVQELKRVDRLMELQEQSSMYSALDKQIREEAWDLAYSSFINASKYTNKENAEDIYRRRKDMTEEDYRNMVYLFEKMQGDLLHAYGSDVAEQLYEETEGEYDTDTLYEVMLKGIELAKEAPDYDSEYSSRQNEIAQEFVWHWSTSVYDDPDSSLDDIADEFREMLSNGDI